MLKGGEGSESKKAANAFQQATQSVLLDAAMQNLSKEYEKKKQVDSTMSSKEVGEKLNTRGDDDDDNNNDDLELQKLREIRISQMKKQQQEMVKKVQKGHGQYQEIEEDQFLSTVIESKYSVVAFYHNDFERCRIVDKHLNLLAPKHLPTRFVKLNADKARFFSNKLNIRMLPTIVCFIDGTAVDRVVGFSDLGGIDDFKTSVLESRLAESGVIATAENLRKFKKMKQKEMKVTSGFSNFV